MALSVVHSFHSGVADDAGAAAAGEVLPSHWNAAHTISGDAAIASSGSASDLITGTVPAARMPALTGDITTTVGAVATTLATVNANTGSWGLAGSVAQFTVNAKGLITAAANVAISIAVSAITGLGSGVATALGINVGSAGAFVTFNGALGTPSSGTLTSTTGLPISTGLTGAGTGVLTGLGVNVGTAGAFVVNGGALGTPSSGTLTNCTGYTAANVASGAALTKTDDTNVTLTLGGTPASALLAASSITVGWSGTLAVARGGLGNASGANWALHSHCGGI